MNNQPHPWCQRSDLQEKIPLEKLLPYCKDYETLALQVALYGSTADQAMLARFNQYLRSGELEARVQASVEKYLKVLDTEVEAPIEDDWDDELDLELVRLRQYPLQSGWFKTLVVLAGSVALFALVMLWYSSARSAQEHTCDRECLREQAVMREMLGEKQQPKN